MIKLLCNLDVKSFNRLYFENISLTPNLDFLNKFGKSVFPILETSYHNYIELGYPQLWGNNYN